jgi:hypothetical protein
MAIQHVVLWRFTTDLSEADQKEVRQRVETSANDIGRLRALRFARLVPAKSARGYQYLMSMVFENEADLANYMKHPLHIELAKWAVDRSCEFLYFDYDPEEAAALRQPA